MAGTTFQKISKPVTSGNEIEEYRWKYRVTELLNSELHSSMPAQADSTATDVAGLVADFNTLLASLRSSGRLL